MYHSTLLWYLHIYTTCHIIYRNYKCRPALRRVQVEIRKLMFGTVLRLVSNPNVANFQNYINYKSWGVSPSTCKARLPLVSLLETVVHRQPCLHKRVSQFNNFSILKQNSIYLYVCKNRRIPLTLNYKL